MAAPTGTKWGSTVGDYGRIGIYVSVSDTATIRTVTLQVWFWSKYSVSDSSNTLYFDVSTSSGGSATTSVGSKSISTTVASGDGWSTSNQVKLYETTKTYTRGSANANKYIYAKLSNVDRVGGEMSVSTYFTVLAKDKYTISYDANGGSGAPSSQTALYGLNLKLSTTKPTREGYTFLGWATSATAATVTHDPGGSYKFTAATTLYAVWQIIAYTVSYNANGGSGEPSNQTKYHGQALTLSSGEPTRSGYIFLGWAKSSAAQSAEFASGSSYTANAAITLYAVWQKTYKKPSIYNVRTARCMSRSDGSGNLIFTENEAGDSVVLYFDWITQEEITFLAVDVTLKNESGETYSLSLAPSANGTTSGSVEQMIYATMIMGDFYPGLTIKATITVSDAGGSTSVTETYSIGAFGVDFHAGEVECDGVAFGKSATLGKTESLGGEGVADFGFDAKFNEPVYGKALGMDRLPAIPENADFDDYIEPGCYAVYSNAIAGTVANIPIDRAGRLEVWSATGEGVRLEQWSYLRQRYIPYNRSNAVWEREVTRGEDNVWNFYEWWRSSLTPAASEKVYSKAAITAVMSAETTLGKVQEYTKVPFTNVAVATSERLYIDDGMVKVGNDISYVKVSGQLVIKCDEKSAVAGNRHIRIQKVSGSTTTGAAWAWTYAVTKDILILNCSPVIVPVKQGDTFKIVFWTVDAVDQIACGSAANGWQSYITVEEI